MVPGIKDCFAIWLLLQKNQWLIALELQQFKLHWTRRKHSSLVNLQGRKGKFKIDVVIWNDEQSCFACVNWAIQKSQVNNEFMCRVQQMQSQHDHCSFSRPTLLIRRMFSTAGLGPHTQTHTHTHTHTHTSNATKTEIKMPQSLELRLKTKGSESWTSMSTDETICSHVEVQWN